MTVNWQVPTLVTRIFSVYWTLTKIMLPALFVVRLLEIFGATEVLAQLLNPLMELVGLPGSVGLVWASAILVNIYAAMVVFVTMPVESLTVAQVTVLGTMILLAHALPVEGAVAKAAGMSWRWTLVVRVGGALVLGVILNVLYTHFDLLQEPAKLVWQPEVPGSDWFSWIKSMALMMAFTLIAIAVLMTLMQMLQWLGIERWIHWLLTPFLRVIGVGKEAANIIVIGAALGLAFGGGLLIAEARAGVLSKRDILLSMTFIALCHSLIEDTLLILLLGADLSGILWARLLFSLLVVAVIARTRLSGPVVA